MPESKTAGKKTFPGKLVVILLIVLGFSLYSVSFYLKGGFLKKDLQADKGNFLDGKTTVSITPSVNPLASVSEYKKFREGVVAFVDDDPFLGDKNAPVTIIEFSDFECPYCKQFFKETLPVLMKNYISSGKVKFVYRDLPLIFHDPLATKEAVAANCAREQEGDAGYFKYHDQIFLRSKSGGKGLTESDLKVIAQDLNLDINRFNSCLDDPAQTEEVKKDFADAQAIGAIATPTFIIGKTGKNGEVKGFFMAGAAPFESFRALIDPLLR